MFLLVGGWNTLFGYAVFAGFYWALHTRVPLAAVIVVAYVVGILNNFLLYKYLVFRTRGHHAREALRFVVVYAPLLAANLIVLPLALRYLPLNAYGVQAIYTFAVLCVAYVGHKYFTFRRVAVGPGGDAGSTRAGVERGKDSVASGGSASAQQRAEGLERR